jgi:two-component system sensor histidine kinase KdpD
MTRSAPQQTIIYKSFAARPFSMACNVTVQRPDPDALLARLRVAQPDARRGRLKLFFGMCAGVGKTYGMLVEAQEKRRAGVDVVVGYVETHARAETDALLADLECLPSKWVEYRGIRLREFDLDAALARKPALILVDELAHTNAEGLRHAKRWQDVSELLDAGIDVATTINVQHVESLNDVVAQIVGITVRETVPDSIVERADEIELVDLPPDDLLQRLREGKVYVPAQAREAAERFFRRENLVALRELALRQTAARVGAQARVERAGRGDTRPWVTTERILVCVGPSPLSARVVRTARRMAAAAQADWVAVNVELPNQGEAARAQMRRNLKLAERLGAETTVLSGEHFADEILAFAQQRNVTKIVIGKPARSRWRDWLHRSPVDELIRRSGEIDVHVVKGEGEESAPAAPGPPRKIKWTAYAIALGIMGLCTAVAFPLSAHFSPENLAMIFLAGVVFVATRYGRGPSILAALLGPLLFNFLFTAPYYTLAIADPQYIVTFVVLLVVALLISTLTQRIRRQSEAARARYLRTAALYFLSRQLAAAADGQSLARGVVRHISDVFQGDAVVLLPSGSSLLLVAGQSGDFDAQAANERAAAEWVYQNQKWAGWSTDTLPATQAIYLPLVTSGASLGVLGLRPHRPEQPLEPDQRHMLETFATQLAIALERTAFAAQAAAARSAAETEQVRSALLSTVSHDLRTPLAAIAGAASTLRDDAGGLDARTRRELLQSISEESSRMNHLVGKLLEMTRLQAPGFVLTREWFPLEELVGAALTRMEAALHSHLVETDLPADLPLVYVDGVLMQELLMNLLENAGRYSPAGSTIRITARNLTDGVRVEVLDEGPGLKPGTEEAIFEKFFRDRPRSERTGTGLGLAICRAISQLHSGRIGAHNRPEGGACFWFTLPPGTGQPPSLTALDSAGMAQAAPNPPSDAKAT